LFTYLYALLFVLRLCTFFELKGWRFFKFTMFKVSAIISLVFVQTTVYFWIR